MLQLFIPLFKGNYVNNMKMLFVLYINFNAKTHCFVGFSCKIMQQHLKLAIKVMMRVNYQKEMDNILSTLGGKVPRLLLHACCGPCSSYVLEYLAEYFEITVLYYNPNIFPGEEYDKRLNELKRLISLIETRNPVRLVCRDYEPQRFYEKSPWS